MNFILKKYDMKNSLLEVILGLIFLLALLIIQIRRDRRLGTFNDDNLISQMITKRVYIGIIGGIIIFLFTIIHRLFF
jgi:hypothetical protein